MIRVKRSCYWLLLGVSCLTTMMKTSAEQKPERQQAANIQVQLSKEDFFEVISAIETFEKEHPLSAYEGQILLNLAYAHFKNSLGQGDEEDEDLQSFLATRDNFLKKFPNHPNVEYLEYLSCRVLEQNSDPNELLYNLFKLSDYKQKPDWAQAALNAFTQFLQNHPESPYALDAQHRWISLYNRKANYLLYIAEALYERKAYVGAVNRCVELLQHNPNSKAGILGLLLLQRSYERLGLFEDAKLVGALFEANKHQLSEATANETSSLDTP